MALEPITRQEKIIAGQDLEPITRMEMFLKQFGVGGGFEYDFIIRATKGETQTDVQYTLEKGTYASIIEKLGKQPLNGKVLVNLGQDVQKSDFSISNVDYIANELHVYATSANSESLNHVMFFINPDNTVTVAG